MARIITAFLLVVALLVPVPIVFANDRLPVYSDKSAATRGTTDSMGFSAPGYEEDTATMGTTLLFDPDQAINVVLPASLDFMIDPMEYDGRGPVYSELYKIENHGENDILLTLSEFDVDFAEDHNFLPIAESVGSAGVTVGADGEIIEKKSLIEHDDGKLIYLELDLQHPDAKPVVMTGPEKQTVTMRLSAATGENPACGINVTGWANPRPDKEWRPGDVKISLKYQLVPAEPVDANSEEDEAESLFEEMPPESDFGLDSDEEEPDEDEFFAVGVQEIDDTTEQNADSITDTSSAGQGADESADGVTDTNSAGQGVDESADGVTDTDSAGQDADESTDDSPAEQDANKDTGSSDGQNREEGTDTDSNKQDEQEIADSDSEKQNSDKSSETAPKDSDKPADISVETGRETSGSAEDSVADAGR